MTLIFKSLILLAALHSQIEGKYIRRNQFCGGANGSDTKWSLELKAGKAYLLEITKRTNEYLSKPKVTLMAGVWEATGDTLTLSQLTKKDEVFVFYKQGNRFVFQHSKSKYKNRELVYLDYIEKN